MPMRLGEREAREAYEYYKELDPGFDKPNDIALLVIYVLQKKMGFSVVQWGMVLDVDTIAGWELWRTHGATNSLYKQGYLENRTQKNLWQITNKGIAYLREQGVAI
ncbi:MAG: hypothetical protein ABIM19_03700 [candidate division WOR-3 bacterium]